MNQQDIPNQQVSTLMGGLGQQFIPWNYPVVKDTRTYRERLQDQKIYYIEQIKHHEIKIKEIDEALELMDKYPLMERFQDLIKKILG